jgi:hypothetical protein
MAWTESEKGDDRIRPRRRKPLILHRVKRGNGQRTGMREETFIATESFIYSFGTLQIWMEVLEEAGGLDKRRAKKKEMYLPRSGNPDGKHKRRPTTLKRMRQWQCY